MFYWRYETGGVSGGSCWDSSDPQGYYNEAPQPALQALDKYLETHYSSITFLQYKALVAMLRTNTGHESEYYGNGTDYLVKYITVREVEDYLKNL